MNKQENFLNKKILLRPSPNVVDFKPYLLYNSSPALTEGLLLVVLSSKETSVRPTDKQITHCDPLKSLNHFKKRGKKSICSWSMRSFPEGLILHVLTFLDDFFFFDIFLCTEGFHLYMLTCKLWIILYICASHTLTSHFSVVCANI